MADPQYASKRELLSWVSRVLSMEITNLDEVRPGLGRGAAWIRAAAPPPQLALLPS